MPDRIVVIPDARLIDGTPYEAAEASVAAARLALDAAEDAITAAIVLTRNAALSRQMDLGGEPDPAAWGASLEHRRLVAALADTQKHKDTLEPVQQSAAFDPSGSD